MNKKIVMSLAVIAAATVVMAGGTIAYFSSIQTSTANIITAGDIDLKVDHTWQSYNDLNCNNFSVTIGSDVTDSVVSTSGGVGDPVAFPHAAKTVAPTSVTIQAWAPAMAGAKWIWATDPVTLHDAQNTVSYTFQKQFEWLGDLSGATLQFAVGADNSYKVTLNGNVLANNLGTEFNFGSTVNIPVPTSAIVQGTNTLLIEVQNIGQPQGTQLSNPAGLLYLLTIQGNPSSTSNTYFQQTCRLWTSKHLGTGDTFFNFDDVKPGDQGTNTISVLVNSNPAYLCMGIKKPVTGSTAGEVLSQRINVVVWKNSDSGKDLMADAGYIQTTLANFGNQGLYLNPALQPGTPQYIHLAWCAGAQTVATDGTITCSGSTMTDGMGQTLMEDLIFQAMQQRNNPNFTCPQL